MLEALGDAKGLALVPEWPGDARMGWIALLSGREHCFIGIQGTAKVGGDLMLFGRTVYQSNITQSAIRLGN